MVDSIAWEKRQEFNAITRFLHTFRHNNAMTLMQEMASEITDRPIRVLEIGCGVGKTFGMLKDRFLVDYVGIDHDPAMIERAHARYGLVDRARFAVADASDPAHYRSDSADIVFALETLEHIPERAVVRIVENVCHIVQPKLFVASVPVEIGPSIWVKTLGSKMMGYKRTPYSWAEAFWAGLYQLNRVPTHQTSHRGFNWFWLEQTIRHNARIRETRSMPYAWLPKFIAPSVMFISEPRGK